MSDTASEVNLMNYLKIFFRRKEVILIPAFIGLVIGICAGIVMPKQYRSSTILLVEEGKSDNPLFSNLAVSTTVGQRLATIRESMLGWNSLVELVKRLKLDKDVKTPQEFENLILGIRKRISIKLKGRNIIHLSYIGNDPELTRDVVKNITEIFVERNMKIQNQETADAIAFIEQQLKLYRGKIKSSELAKLKDKLKTLLMDSTEEHPQVKMLREKIAAKEAEIKKENLEVTEDVTIDPDTTTNPIIKEIKSALENIEGKDTVAKNDSSIGKEYYKVMLIDKLDKAMARDEDVNKRIYNMLLQRLEKAKITQRLQASKEGTKYTILDPPRVPLRPISPNRLLVAIGGLMAGLLFGIGLVFATELLDRSFIDVEEAKQFLGIPLLGAISKINTPESIRAQKERMAWLYSLTIIFGIIAIILTKAISNFME